MEESIRLLKFYKELMINPESSIPVTEFEKKLKELYIKSYSTYFRRYSFGKKDVDKILRTFKLKEYKNSNGDLIMEYGETTGIFFITKLGSWKMNDKNDDYTTVDGNIGIRTNDEFSEFHNILNTDYSRFTHKQYRKLKKIPVSLIKHIYNLHPKYYRLIPVDEIEEYITSSLKATKSKYGGSDNLSINGYEINPFEFLITVFPEKPPSDKILNLFKCDLYNKVIEINKKNNVETYIFLFNNGEDYSANQSCFSIATSYNKALEIIHDKQVCDQMHLTDVISIEEGVFRYC